MKLEELIAAHQDPSTPTDLRVKLELKRRDWAKRCREDFWYFVKAVISRRYGKFYEPLHGEVCDFLGKEETQLVLIPRGTYKSTIVSVAYPLWLVCKYPNVRILIVSEVLKHPLKWVREQLHFMREDLLYRWLFPEIVPEDARDFGTTTAWTVLNRKAPWGEATVTIGSLGTDFTSQHYEIIICDDIVGKENSRTKHGLESAKDWYRKSIPLLEPPKSHPWPSPKPHYKIVGTRWDWSDLYSDLLQTDIPSMVKKAIDGGKLLFPTILDEAELRKRRQMQGSHDFSSQYLMEPISADDALFRPENTKYFDDNDILGKKLQVRISVDLAISEKASADRSVVMATGTDSNGMLYVLEYWADRSNPDVVARNIYRLFDKYGAENVLIETVGYQKSFLNVMKNHARHVGRALPIVEIRPDVDKRRRALTLQPFHENGWLFLRRNMMDLEEEMYKFGSFVHDDVVDALTMVTASGHAWAPKDAKPEPTYLSYAWLESHLPDPEGEDVEYLNDHLAFGGFDDPWDDD